MNNTQAIPTWEPAEEYQCELVQVVRYHDGSKQFRLKIDGVTLDLSLCNGEIDGFQQDTPETPLPNWYEYWLAE